MGRLLGLLALVGGLSVVGAGSAEGAGGVSGVPGGPRALGLPGGPGVPGGIGPVRHFVSFRFRPDVLPAVREEVRRRFLALKDVARDPYGRPYVLSIEAGDANSPEGADQGMTQGYLVTFRNVRDRNYYVGRPQFSEYDPAHDAFKAFVGPFLDVDARGRTNGVFVFDFVIGAVR